MSESVTTRVELTGPFFTHDPGKTLYANIGTMLDGLAEEMERLTRTAVESRSGQMPFWTGWTRDTILGYRTSPKTGKHWALWAAVAAVTEGMDRKHAIRTKAAAASIERRWHPFRQTKSAVYRSRALISADLAKGLN